MNLIETFNQLQTKTDKGTTHDYLNGYYNDAFTPYKDQPIELLEIGIHRGASIELWSHFFPKANIIGLDNEDLNYIPTLKNNYETDGRHIIIRICDAYNDEWVNRFDNGRFDFIIDDGPHTLKSQITTIEKYLPKLKLGGRLIIEDIQSESDLKELAKVASATGMEYNIFDLRNNKGRYDDIILEIIKNK
jgi:hypothetical protein